MCTKEQIKNLLALRKILLKAVLAIRWLSSLTGLKRHRVNVSNYKIRNSQDCKLNGIVFRYISGGSKKKN
jgi:hypothetical protein